MEAPPVRSIARAVGEALRGVHHGARERNFRIHRLSAIAVSQFACVVALGTAQRLAIILCIALVLSSELINSAVEAAVDLATKDWNGEAGRAKDVAAGAVLVAAIAAVLAFAEILGETFHPLLDACRRHPQRAFTAVALLAFASLPALPISQKLRRAGLLGAFAAALSEVFWTSSYVFLLATALLLIASPAYPPTGQKTRDPERH